MFVKRVVFIVMLLGVFVASSVNAMPEIVDTEDNHITGDETLAKIYDYRDQGDLQKAVDYCKAILKSNYPHDIIIEACTQLGDIYYNEFNDRRHARKFVNRGIRLVKKHYTPSTIEYLVNGMDFEIDSLQAVGKSNTIRELYVLKSDIENAIPSFKVRTKFEELFMSEDRIYDIKYRTDW